MDVDDIVYFGILILTVVIGPYIREIKNVETKQLVSTFIGVCITFVVSGTHFYHPFLVTLVNGSILLVFNKRHCYIYSFIFSFVYLAFSRSMHLIGLTSEPIPQQLLAIQMMHVLKMVGLAFEVRDTQTKTIGKTKMSDLEYRCCRVNPGFMDVFHYSFCYIGLITGPYFSFKTYMDWLHMPFSKLAFKFSKIKNEKLKIVIYARADSDIHSYSFVYCWWYMNPVFVNFRLRLYIAFLMAECSCMSSGFGIYPESTKPKAGKGPTDFTSLTDNLQELSSEKYSYETINNSHIFRVEFGATIRETVKYWNMSVQYWFAVYVHKRISNFRSVLTLLASAFWHGVYPGYYLCFLTIPFAMNAESWMIRALPIAYTVKGNLMNRWICCLFKTQMMAYLGMGFFLLKIEDVYCYWKSLYFSGHIALLCVYLLARFICTQKESAKNLLADDQIRDKYKKQIISTLIGLTLTIIVSGTHSIHPILVTLINSAIVMRFKKKCHVISPYFTFRTYSDWLNKPYSRCANTTSMMLRRIRIVPVYIAALFLGSHFFPLDYARAEIYSRSAFYRWFYQIPLFFNFRMRLFIAFVLSECCCIANGLGIYPSATKPNVGQGPTDYQALLQMLTVFITDSKDEESLKKEEYSFETIHNIEEYGAEVKTTVRDAMRTWNMSIQYWLAMFVYKRVKVFRIPLTMLTSAFWHGIYSGYYLSLLTVPFVFAAEGWMESAVRRHLNSFGQKIYDVFSWFFKTNMYGYLGMGFFLVNSGDTLEYWKSMYFFGHFLTFFFYVLARLIAFVRKSSNKDEKKK
uniref:Lysophospholipid acyltransferase 7 n=1 Tax=Strigamia maritima TaxID=126957 RepID=T1JBR7_STRMM